MMCSPARPLEWNHKLPELTSDELPLGKTLPLLNRRRELTRDQGIRLRHQKPQGGDSL